jgi:hypothetical protein
LCSLLGGYNRIAVIRFYLALTACAAPQERGGSAAAQQAGQEQGDQSEDAKEREKAYKRGGY